MLARNMIAGRRLQPATTGISTRAQQVLRPTTIAQPSHSELLHGRSFSASSPLSQTNLQTILVNTIVNSGNSNGHRKLHHPISFVPRYTAQRVGIALFRHLEGAHQLLVFKRRVSRGYYPGTWTLPSRRIKKGDTIYSAIRDGMFAATGLTVTAAVREFEPLEWFEDWAVCTQMNFVVHVEQSGGRANTNSSLDYHSFKWVCESEVDSLECAEHEAQLLRSAFKCVREGEVFVQEFPEWPLPKDLRIPELSWPKMDHTLEDLKPKNATHLVGTPVFKVSDDSRKMLVLRRSATEDLFPGMWTIPGGHIEYEETIREAIVRELKEETRLDAHDVIAWLDRLMWTDESGQKFVQWNFLVTVKGDRNVELNLDEHDSWMWVCEEAMEGLECSEGIRRCMRDAFMMRGVLSKATMMRPPRNIRR